MENLIGHKNDNGLTKIESEGKLSKDAFLEEFFSKNQIQKKGGFRKIEGIRKDKRCGHPEHNPPGMIVLEPGTWEYTCPSCGYTRTIFVPEITL